MEHRLQGDAPIGILALVKAVYKSRIPYIYTLSFLEVNDASISDQLALLCSPDCFMTDR